MAVDTKPRVIMVGPDPEVRGGISTVVNELLGNGLRDYADVTYISSTVDGSKMKKVAQLVRALVQYRKALRVGDMVHIHVSLGGSYKRKRIFARMARAASVPYILHEHDGSFDSAYDGGSERYRRGVRRLFGSAAKVIVLSEEWRDYFAVHVCDESKLVVLHNGVSLPDLSQRKSKTSEDPIDILYMGVLNSRKSPDILIRAASELPEGLNLRFIFAGNGNLEEYRSLARFLGVAERCQFLGWVKGKERERLYLTSDIYCLPSKNEGMPMSVLEAMSYGLPVITTPVGGIPQVISDGIDGLIMPVGDVKQLVSELSMLIESYELRNRMGRAARDKIEVKFNISDIVMKLANTYGQVLRRP